jgi:AraC family transcriptional regulator
METGLPSQQLMSSADLSWRTVAADTYRDPPEAEFTPDPSPDLFLVLVTSGSYAVQTRHWPVWRRADYRPGSIGVTAPGQSSMVRWQGGGRPMESLHLHVRGELVRDSVAAAGQPDGLPGAFDTLSLDDPYVTATAYALGRALHERAPGLYADSLAQALVTHLVHRHAPKRGRTPAFGPAALTRHELADVTEYMRAHLADDVDLDTLAGLAKVSKYHFLRQFSASTGLTPHRYLVRMRMQLASDLLLTTRQNVLQISTSCGYRSSGQFTAAFRRQFGVPPGNFRRTSRNHGDGGG